jgi:hypothetical protein
MIKAALHVATCLTVSLLFFGGGQAWPRVNTSDRQIQAVSGFSYTATPDETAEKAQSLALFGAKYKAVVRCADQLVKEGLLQSDDKRNMAIFCLVADTMQPHVIEQSLDTDSHTYTVKINSTLSLTDYVKAEIRNEALDKEEIHFSLKEELEPSMSPDIAPALELSRTYRYISHDHWRMAIIYMDHLENKYPRWGALHLAKATAFLGMHENGRALNELSSACYLGTQEACLEFDTLDPPE